MNDIHAFAVVLLVIAIVGIGAVLSNRLGEWLPVPAPALFLVGAAAASDIWPRLETVPSSMVERGVTLALVVILFDGGMQIGWRKFRDAAAPIVWIGVAGTLATAGLLTVAAHGIFGLGWRIALLLGTALSPTDPAVVFSVLGRRRIEGRSAVLLQGESAANDPVGIALLVAILAAPHLHPGAVAAALGTFTLQLLVGAVGGAAAGVGLLWFMRRVPLPSSGLYSLRVLLSVMGIYAAVTLAHGSGFLAVLVAGVVIGDQRAPFKTEIVRFHSALANLAEIIAFVLLGLTIQLTGPHGVADGNAWLIGLGLAGLLALVIRPLVAGLLLWQARLTRGERGFVAWTGLKGAVPILLGTFILHAAVPDSRRAYEIIFVVVAFSVIVQGGLVPVLARRLGVRLSPANPRPWGMSARFEEEPDSLHRFVVAAGSPAEGTTVADLPSDDLWVSVIIRQGRLVTVTPTTALRTGDEVLVIAEPDNPAELAAIFTPTHPGDRARRPRALPATGSALLRAMWLARLRHSTSRAGSDRVPRPGEQDRRR